MEMPRTKAGYDTQRMMHAIGRELISQGRKPLPTADYNRTCESVLVALQNQDAVTTAAYMALGDLPNPYSVQRVAGAPHKPTAAIEPVGV
jgi:hypothetical protein